MVMKHYPLYELSQATMIRIAQLCVSLLDVTDRDAEQQATAFDLPH